MNNTQHVIIQNISVHLDLENYFSRNQFEIKSYISFKCQYSNYSSSLFQFSPLFIIFFLQPLSIFVVISLKSQGKKVYNSESSCFVPESYIVTVLLDLNGGGFCPSTGSGHLKGRKGSGVPRSNIS